VRLYAQQATLPARKIERPARAPVQSPVLQNLAVRSDLAFQAFFRRVKTGEQEPGYPGFRGQGRYDRRTFPQVPVGCRLESTHRRVANVGQVQVLLQRPLEGTPKTATIRRSSTGKWSVAFSCECAEPSPLPELGQQVGVDVGLKTCAMLSTGQAIANPRFFRHAEPALAKAQRRRSKAEKGTPERAERRKVVARVYERSAWRRSDCTHQHRRRIVNAVELIAVADVSVNRMRHHQCLAKSIADAAWTQFADTLAHKAAWAGRSYVAVNPAYTRQDCSGCGHRQKRSLSDRIYACPCCGLVLDRDLNAARNILALGQQCLASAEKLPA
jgi:putative transposase